jgi:hypothetical protein
MIGPSGAGRITTVSLQKRSGAIIGCRTGRRFSGRPMWASVSRHFPWPRGESTRWVIRTTGIRFSVSMRRRANNYGRTVTPRIWATNILTAGRLAHLQLAVTGQQGGGLLDTASMETRREMACPGQLRTGLSCDRAAYRQGAMAIPLAHSVRSQRGRPYCRQRPRLHFIRLRKGRSASQARRRP